MSATTSATPRRSQMPTAVMRVTGGVGMSDITQCGAVGPGGVECTRTTNGHDTHTAYVELKGQLTHISWFECNPIGEPTERDCDD